MSLVLFILLLDVLGVWDLFVEPVESAVERRSESGPCEVRDDEVAGDGVHLIEQDANGNRAGPHRCNVIKSLRTNTEYFSLNITFSMEELWIASTFRSIFH